MKNYTITLFMFLVAITTAYGQPGNVGINTMTPRAALHVKDSSVLFAGPVNISPGTGTLPVGGPGNRTMWFSNKAAFRTGGVTGMHWDRDSIGNFSFASGNSTVARGSCSMATGQNTRAIGTAAFASGYNTHAMGHYSTALGYWNQAEGFYSTALGLFTMAGGEASTAIGHTSVAGGAASLAAGYNLKANGYGSTVIGINNDSITGPQEELHPETPLFIIGNGADQSQRKNAVVVRYNGRMGIGTNTPVARLHVKDSSVVFTGPYYFSTPGDVPVSGPGSRMMWYADKAAFRAGTVYNTQWDKDNIGTNSFAVGSQTTASAHYSSAFGENTDALGIASLACGDGSEASGYASIAAGDETYASGYAALAAGWNTEATLDEAVALNTATKANGSSSTALGHATIANASACLALGKFNAPLTDPMPPYEYAENHPLLIVGNGADIVNRHNAMVLFSNGRMGLGTDYPVSRLDVHVPEQNMQVARFTGAGTGWNEIIVANADATIDFGVSGSETYLGAKTVSALTFRTGATPRMKISASGNVGIGTSSPGSMLEVNGSASKPGGGNWSASSDARLKQNVTSYSDGLAQVLNIHPVSYQYNAQSGFDVAQLHVGVIAQELQTIAPYMVSTSEKVMADGTTGYLQVDNSAMVYMLINAVKELKSMVDALQEQLAAQKAGE